MAGLVRSVGPGLAVQLATVLSCQPHLRCGCLASPPCKHRSSTPSLTVHAPQLDLAVVGARHDERQRGVERCPVDAAVVALRGGGRAGAGVGRERLQWLPVTQLRAGPHMLQPLAATHNHLRK